jgi:hypothetical protein
MDPGFNLHLRRDHIAEVWAVEKQTRAGPTVSVEAFDAEGGLIAQVFGLRKETDDHRAAFAALVADLPGADAVETERMLPIGGSVTEIVHALGQGHRLIAQDGPGILERIAVVGQALGVPDRAAALVADTRAALAATARQSTASPRSGESGSRSSSACKAGASSKTGRARRRRGSTRWRVR